jgi:serine kinase
VASGLQYLHSKIIAHRKLKWEIILLSKHFKAKLTHFSFARFYVDSDCYPVVIETYCCSLSYAAPEIVIGTSYNIKIADVWSLGIILFFMSSALMSFDISNESKFLKEQMSRKLIFRLHTSRLAKFIEEHFSTRCSFTHYCRQGIAE